MTALNGTRQPQLSHHGEAETLAGRIVKFVRLARANNFRVGIQEEIDALKVAGWVNITDQRHLRWGLQSLLCSNDTDWERFDKLFDTYWRRPNRRSGVLSASRKGARIDTGDFTTSGNHVSVLDVTRNEHGNDGDAGKGASRGGASHRETLARSDFRLLSNQNETRDMEQWIEAVARRMRRHLLRRQRIQRHGQRIHLRRTLRHSLRYGGLPLDLIFQQRRRDLPRLVLITDVSRSMSLYSYLFLRFARGIIDAFKDADAFVFHTRLVHITDALRERDSHRLKEKLIAMSTGWGGGTRIGECLQIFNREYARRLVHSRTFVFVMSDGYDTGDPELLAEQIQRIKQRAKRVVWLNPLLGREKYEPVAKGMQAALPYLDLFATAHSLESLRKIESYLINL